MKLTAKIDNVNIKETINVLQEIKEKKADGNGIIKVAGVKGDNFVNSDNYVIDLEIGLDDVATSTEWFTEVLDKDGKVDYWISERFVYYKQDVAFIKVVEKWNQDGFGERKFVYGDKLLGLGNENYAEIFDTQTYNTADLLGWKNIHYVVKKRWKIEAFKSDALVKIKNSFVVGQNTKLGSAVAIGGAYEADKLTKPMLGKINKFIIETSVGSGNGISASSTLFIDLYDPKVVKFWPNCLAACVNTGIGVKFNMPMFEPDYKGAIEIEQCNDETCVDKEPIGWKSDVSTSNEYILRALPTDMYSFLAPDAWYLVTVSKGVRALTNSIQQIRKNKRGQANERGLCLEIPHKK